MAGAAGGAAAGATDGSEQAARRPLSAKHGREAAAEPACETTHPRCGIGADGLGSKRLRRRLGEPQIHGKRRVQAGSTAVLTRAYPRQHAATA